MKEALAGNVTPFGFSVADIIFLNCHHRRNLEDARGANAPTLPIIFAPKNSFLATELKSEKIKK
jgi:hypothetical protein